MADVIAPALNAGSVQEGTLPVKAANSSCAGTLFPAVVAL
jgi:hypothetical protein